MTSLSDKKLKRIIKQFLGNFGNPSGQCYMVSIALKIYLSEKIKLETRLVSGFVQNGKYLEPHWWLEMGDNIIIDATGSQFKELKMPIVYIGFLPNFYNRSFFVN